MTYGAFYFCRTNISAAVPGMTAPLSAGGLGLDPLQVGVILAALKICYGLGQLVNGQLSERVSPRLLLAIGMFGSALLNVLFGLGVGFYFLLFVWACNGYCQSLGWTPCVRVVGNWIPTSWRGKALGIIGTGYQVTLGLTYLVAAYSAQWFGWRGAVFVPAGVLTVAGIATLLLLTETPEKVATDPEFEGGGQRSSPRKSGVSENLYLTLYNPTLWLLGLSLGLLNACRYGFLDWGLAHLMEVQQTTIGKAGLKYCVIALGAVLGSYYAGVATDRFFGGRRAPMVCLLLLLLGLLTLLYESVSRSSVGGTIVLLGVIGFCIYGPQVLLVGTAPADLAHKGTAAAAAGFVNFMGYMGAATGDVVTGYYSVAEHGGWQLAISIWAGWAFAAALASGLLWNATASRLRLLDGWVPVVVGACLLLLSALLVYLITGVHWVVITASGGALLLPLARYREPRLAWFTGIASLVGLIALLLGWVPDQSLSSWYTVLPRVGHGLGILAALMVVVEKR
ncbi:MAG: MFS transporter [Planctomycetota bacterium]|nr:MFS transporter [Planctomycetota bacterium]